MRGLAALLGREAVGTGKRGCPKTLDDTQIRLRTIIAMPHPANGERSYRIKGGRDGHEHAVTESQIVSAEDYASADLASSSRKNCAVISRVVNRLTVTTVSFDLILTMPCS